MKENGGSKDGEDDTGGLLWASSPFSLSKYEERCLIPYPRHADSFCLNPVLSATCKPQISMTSM